MEGERTRVSRTQDEAQWSYLGEAGGLQEAQSWDLWM